MRKALRNQMGLALLAALALGLAAGCTNKGLEATPEEVRAALDSGRPVVVVDVREPDEWMAGHLQKAQSFPLSRFEQGLPPLDKGEEIYVYCHSGRRSMAAVQQMRQDGFTNVKSMAGGIVAWRGQIDPTLSRY